MDWFTSDTHFGHKNIIKHSSRPFLDVDEMDDVLIENINKTVGKHDRLYHLGDFAFRDPAGYRDRIKCDNVYLVIGNHDRVDGRLRSLFRDVDERMYINIDGQKLVLDHYAMRVWKHSHHGAWQLYGHSHGSLPDDPNSLSFDVGVDCWNYRPINFDQVAKKMATKTFVPVDHHASRSGPTVSPARVPRY